MGLIVIKISLQEKSYSGLKKRFPTMCETLEALRNPPLHLLDEERIIKKVNYFLMLYINSLPKCTCVFFKFVFPSAYPIRNT